MADKKNTIGTPVKLILELSKIFDGIMRVEMKRNGMKTSYRHLLGPLATKDGVTQLDLVRVSKLKAPTVSTTLRNMEAEGLVTRETDKDDARATRVFITDKGREINAKMVESFKQAERVFLKSVSEQEKKELITVLDKMYTNLRGYGDYSVYDY